MYKLVKLQKRKSIFLKSEKGKSDIEKIKRKQNFYVVPDSRWCNPVVDNTNITILNLDRSDI